MLHCIGVTVAELVDGILAASSFAAAFNRSSLREAITTLQPVKTKPDAFLMLTTALT